MDDSLDVSAGDSVSVAGSGAGSCASRSALALPSPPSTSKKTQEGGARSSASASTRASTGGSDKGGAGSGGSNSTGKKNDPNAFVCQLGGCKTVLSEKVPGFQWCRSCKKVYDCLARMSKVQKEEGWWENTKSSAKDLRKAILHCKKAFPNEGGRGKARLPGFKVGVGNDPVSP